MTQSEDHKVSKESISCSFDGAVAVKDSDSPVDDLLNLLKDVRVALAIDPFTHKLPFSKITYGECAFDLPETGEPYAFFSQKVILEIVEPLC